MSIALSDKNTMLSDVKKKQPLSSVKVSLSPAGAFSIYFGKATGTHFKRSQYPPIKYIARLNDACKNICTYDMTKYLVKTLARRK